jgi:hypothetical protein
MKKIIYVIVLNVLMLNAFSQTGYFKTYDDYKNNKMEVLDTYESYVHVMGGVTLTFKKSGKKVKVPCGPTWGFMVDGALFRNHNAYAQPTRVVSVGEIVYCENGLAHLDMIKNKSDKGNFSVGYFSYLAKDLKSDLTPIPKGGLDTANKLYKKFKLENPKHKDLYSCIDDGTDYQKIRNCIADYNGME